LRDKAQKAFAAKLPLFVSEWGTCEATGNGAVSEAETKLWMSLLAQHQISWANWSLNDKDETCSALRPGASATGPWPDASITSSGALVKPLIGARF
jgi:endoglucanase